MRKNLIQQRVDFDKVISDSISHAELNFKERPLNRIVFYVVLFSAVLVSIIFWGRSAFLSILEHDRYVERSEANINQTIPLIAPRGIILDRNGTPLVENKVIFSVFLRLDEMIRNNEKEKVLDVAEEILSLDRETVESQLENTNIENVTDIILKREVSREQVITIETRNLSSLFIENDYMRSYSDPAFSHIVGYVGLVNKDDLQENEKLVLNDLIGRAGLEAFYDDRLRGENGSIAIYRNVMGGIESAERSTEPITGEKLETTIDAELQKYFYNRMVQGLLSLGRTSGAGIAINPQNGEILALLSFPSFDANDISKYLGNPSQPLFNRSVSGLYSPGSTIKPVHAIAALSEKVIVPEKQIYSAGYIEVPNPYDPENPSRFLDWKPHGWVDLYSAIARSSNVYFYTVGGGFEDVKGVGIRKLKEYWQYFGLDKKTGIDLPGEAAGILPDPEEKEERTGSIWRVGDTYNVAIGQGDFRITPIELIDTTVVISNGGQAFIPHIVKKEKEILIDLPWLKSEIEKVQKGMEDAVSRSYGTAYLLADIPMTIAAKTGSAQTTGNTKTNALFIGYAPAENPKIAILILVEDALEGSLNAVPIARDVFEWYYENRIKE